MERGGRGKTEERRNSYTHRVSAVDENLSGHEASRKLVPRHVTTGDSRLFARLPHEAPNDAKPHYYLPILNADEGSGVILPERRKDEGKRGNSSEKRVASGSLLARAASMSRCVGLSNPSGAVLSLRDSPSEAAETKTSTRVAGSYGRAVTDPSEFTIAASYRRLCERISRFGHWPARLSSVEKRILGSGIRMTSRRDRRTL